MSTTATITEVPAVSEHAIKAEANRILAQTAQKHNVNVEDIGPEVVARAVEQARANLEKAAADSANPFRALYEQERKARELAEGTLQSIRASQQGGSKSDARPAISAEAAKARMGLRAWNGLSTPQRIAALGIEPASVDLEAVKRVFGKGASTTLANDLMKSDALKYRQWKEVALASGVYGS
jgi:hypothetical protein